MLKIAYCIMGEKGLYSLEKTIEKYGPEIIDWVVSSIDEHVQNDYYHEILNCCNLNSIKVYKKSELNDLSYQVLILISWRWIIPNSLNKSIIVLHDSLLPKYRGFAPLVNQLISGESNLGVTALFPTNKYDTGAIIHQKSLPVSYPLKIENAIKLICPLYFELLKHIIDTLISEKKLISKEQTEKDATYSLWRDEEDYRINWNDTSEKIHRIIDALGYPYAGAHTYFEDHKIIIHDVKPVDDLIIENRTPGKIIFFEGTFPVIVCGKGLLMIKKAEFYSTKKSFLPPPKFRIRFL